MDDLIENARKRIEFISRSLFNIFNKFETTDSILFKNAFQTFNGGIFKSKDYVNYSENKLITIKNIDDNGFNTANTSYLSNNKIEKRYLLSLGDIVMTMTGNIGRVGMVDKENCYLNQRVLKIRSACSAYLYCFLTKYKQTIIQLGKGTAQLNLSLDDLNNLAVRNSLADIDLFKRYEPLYYLLLNLHVQINKLIIIKEKMLSKYF